MRLVALISGSGTTLQNLIDRQVADIVGVVASRADAFGIQRAERAGIPVRVIPAAKKRKVEEWGTGAVEETNNSPTPSLVHSSTAYSEIVFAAARVWQPDLVCLCGWLKLLTIPADFEQKVLNIHPSLLPKFGGPGMYGRHVHEAVLAAGETESGCTVHYADNTYDTGPILVQRKVPVLVGDTPESLAKRVFEAECEAYPEAIRLATTRSGVHG